MKPQRVIGQHDRIEVSGGDQLGNVIGCPMGCAKYPAKPPFPLLSYQEVDHPPGTPDLFPQGFAVLNARNPEHFKACLVEFPASAFKQILEMCQVAVAL